MLKGTKAVLGDDAKTQRSMRSSRSSSLKRQSLISRQASTDRRMDQHSSGGDDIKTNEQDRDPELKIGDSVQFPVGQRIKRGTLIWIQKDGGKIRMDNGTMIRRKMGAFEKVPLPFGRTQLQQISIERKEMLSDSPKRHEDMAEGQA